ncbi:hypothetical protein [Rossellomorea sp. NS-SX7]|uniref:hypothetical protein n=1 Tax=Rossellomorea sp. NS-SX7 TaxID=3463856 RepID=UPI004059B1B6
MIKRKAASILISIPTVILVTSLLFPMESPLTTLSLYTFYGGFLMITAGAPVSILAGMITTKIKWQPHLVNFLIHMGPSIVISFFMFGDMGFSPFFGIPLVAASIFFIVDEIVFHKVSLKRKKAKWMFAIPLVLFSVFGAPYYFIGLKGQYTSSQINQKGPPSVTLLTGEEPESIRSSYCWTSDGTGCSYDTNPFPLPPEEGVDFVDEIELKEPTALKFQFDNSKGEPTLHAYYNDGSGKKMIKTEGSEITIPSDIPEQGVKIVAKWDNHEIVWFFVGVRTGIPTNGRTF